MTQNECRHRATRVRHKFEYLGWGLVSFQIRFNSKYSTAYHFELFFDSNRVISLSSPGHSLVVRCPVVNTRSQPSVASWFAIEAAIPTLRSTPVTKAVFLAIHPSLPSRRRQAFQTASIAMLDAQERL